MAGHDGTETTRGDCEGQAEKGAVPALAQVWAAAEEPRARAGPEEEPRLGGSGAGGHGGSR